MCGGVRVRAESVGGRLAAGLDAIAGRHADVVGEHRGLGPMRALELREQDPALAAAVCAAALDRGLLVLACGTHGNVLRLLPPLTIGDDELVRGLELLEAALDDARGRAAG
jgi:4-aminobutyrate aminotransferase/(S)-3-amino-2-methylpropionate transaminase